MNINHGNFEFLLSVEEMISEMHNKTTSNRVKQLIEIYIMTFGNADDK
jgi:hypothetical protein